MKSDVVKESRAPPAPRLCQSELTKMNELRPSPSSPSHRPPTLAVYTPCNPYVPPPTALGVYDPEPPLIEPCAKCPGDSIPNATVGPALLKSRKCSMLYP